MLEGVSEAASICKQLEALKKNSDYGHVASQLYALRVAVQQICTSKAVSRNTLMDMADKVADFHGKQEDKKAEKKLILQ